MKMNKLALSAALALAMVGAAHAHGGSGGAGVIGGAGVVAGGFLTGYQGSVNGNVSSSSSGMSISGVQVNGTGASFQTTQGTTGGNATVGGVVNAGGATVKTDTNNWSTTSSAGFAVGNTPSNTTTATGQTNIVNGSVSGGQTATKAEGWGSFQTATIGAVGGIGAIGGAGVIGGWFGN